MKKIHVLVAFVLGAMLAGCCYLSNCSCGDETCSACDGCDGCDEGEEVAVPLDQVPDEVKAAACAAVPGLVIEEASMEVEDGVTLYDIEGVADGKEYEVEVSADGKVIEVEEDEEDDDDDDDEDDDDEDDD